MIADEREASAGSRPAIGSVAIQRSATERDAKGTHVGNDMRLVPVDDHEPEILEDGTTRIGLGDELGTEHVAINRYRVPPGGHLPAGLHAHADQEEVFVVHSGAATFETLDGRVTVDEGEVIRFSPGEFQSGRNEGDDPLVVLALGAPRENDDIRIPITCSDCGHDDLRLESVDGAVSFTCPVCTSSRTATTCPDCSGDDLHITLEESGDEPSSVIVRCRDCDGSFDRPPVATDW